MKIGALINVVLVGTITAGLTGLMLKSGDKGQADAGTYEYELLEAPANLPPDTPEVKEPVTLPYDFKDNNGKPPQYNPDNKLYLQDPSNIKTTTEYNAENGTYDVKQKIGDMDYRPETYMSLKEYRDYMFNKSVHDYWRTKVAADDLNNRPKKGLVPKLQVNSELFDRIFGGNTVDIRPTGTAELIFGLNRNKTLNPAIPQRQQKVTNFDFNMRIQLNLIGKIGDKLKITTNYNTEASFDWENQVKMDYTGYEDEIIKKIEAGNVTLPLNSTLITGSQSLFGVKTELQFGRLRMTTVLSQQRGKKQEVNVQGGAQTQQFSVNAENYEANKHYFLSHYFRDNYDGWMASLPVINSPVVITRVEVYVLNQTGNQEQTRNVAAFADLGEDSTHTLKSLQLAQNNVIPSQYALVDSTGAFPSNGANNLYSVLTNSVNGLITVTAQRDGSKVKGVLASTQNAQNIANASKDYMLQARDFDVISNARRLNANEFTINPRLGYISLNQAINNDQVLAVSFQYTFGGKTYQVGEFSDQFPDNTKALVVKLLKGSLVSTRYSTWDLMMKNVYTLGAYNLNAQDFKLDIYYNNIETGVDIPYLPYGAVNGLQLIRVLNCDKLSVNGDRFSDGVFDFLKDYTINPVNGRVYLPMVEPFGSGLRSKFDQNNDFPTANKYVFQELYDSTKVAASFITEKSRYKIKGSYRSASGSEITLNALNIPQGAVVVSANGVTLTENTDYTVDYTLGRVKIINEGILNSGSQIKVSVESNSLFNIQQKSLIANRFDFKVNRDLTLGGTFMRYNERPITQKVNIGDEPVSNIIAGVDYNYKTELPFLTRWIDKLPLISTKEMSSITTRGEFAKLFPGNAKAIGRDGNSYIDDFEGSISLIDVRNPNSWFLASIPQGQPALFPEAAGTNTISTNNNRARLNWYTIDPMFTRSQSGTTPSYYDKNIFSNNLWRQVLETELFPGKGNPNGQPNILPVLDLAYYPTQRGPYNYDVLPSAYTAGMDANGLLKSPQARWGGIMRRLETNDFQAANIEYVQFWMMDPYNEDYDVATDTAFDKNRLPSGDLFINLGNVSEDVIKDGKMSYENGLRGLSSITQGLQNDTTFVGISPSLPPIANAFSTDNNDRPKQDVGYDGMDNDAEKAAFQKILNDVNQFPGINGNAKFVQDLLNDPSSDDYHFFRGDDYDNAQFKTLDRYRLYNNTQGNSPTEDQYKALGNSGNYPTVATTIPNIEDLNRDNTLSETENYYQYRIKITPQDIKPGMVGTNYLVDAFDGTANIDGINKTVKWYQFKVPVNQFESAIGDIEGFNSIRFMRVFMRGFNRPVVLRLARFELVRSDWRRYQFDLTKPGEYIKGDDDGTSFDVSAVSVQENSSKSPVNYVIPPGIQQQQNVQTTNLVLLNEQALQMRVCNLKDGDSRAIFKNMELDTRMFEHIRMFVHGEQLGGIPLNNGDLTVFVRVGSDYNNNYYEYEIPLQLTPKGTYDPNSDDGRNQVWPSANEIDIKFSDLSSAKANRNARYGYFTNLNTLSTPYTQSFSGGYNITVVGNPNLGTVKGILIGIRNPKDDGRLAHCAEVWVNELRLTDFNNQGGWAATAQMQAKLADLGQVSLAGTYSTPFFGSVEKKINERSKETQFNWDLSTNLNAGKFFPQKWKVSLPVYYNYGQTRITPFFNPLDPDQRMNDVKKSDDISDDIKEKIINDGLDFTERKGINLTNVRIDGLKRKKAKPMPWDVSNFSVTYAYNETYRRNVNIENSVNKQYRGNVTYQFNIQKPPVFKPFSKSKSKLLNNKWMALVKEANLQLLPNSFGAGIDVTRNFSELKNRDITSFYSNAEDLTFAQFNKQFLINRNYNLRWDLTKNLKYDYSASNEGRVLEPFGRVDKNYEPQRDSVIDNLMKGGTNIAYRQSMNLNYNIPINKIPILDFATLTYRFSGTYSWMRRPFAAADSIGNTIQNTNSHNITANFNMMTLYNKIPYFKRVNSGQQKGGKVSKEASKSSIGLTDSTNPKRNESFKDIAAFIAKGIMMIKNVSITWQQTNGQALPNFKPTSQYAGMDFRQNMAPGFLFTTGLHDDNIRQRSAQNGWLARVPTQTSPYTETYNNNLTYRSSVEPHGSLRIELNGNLTKSRSLSEYMLYDTINKRFDFGVSPVESGNFNITTFSFFKSFTDRGTGAESALFTEFLTRRFDYARELAAANSNSKGELKDANGKAFIDGYSVNQQDVIIGTFYDTYTGRRIKGYNTKNPFPSFPMPNWTISWDGLGKIKALQKTFRSITIRHGYRSTYNIGGFSNNLLYGDRAGGQVNRAPNSALVINGVQNNDIFVPYYSINAVTITEAFSPLLKFDFQFVKTGWQANAEMRRDKTITLNITGPQIIETKGQEYIVGLGYRYPRLKMNKFKIFGKPLESDLNIKVDVSYRRNLSIIRNIVKEFSTPTGGTDIITLRSSADYNITQNINIRLFYDWIRNKPQTTASFPTSNATGGFSLRINFQ